MTASACLGGFAASYGLSASGLVLGAFVARGLETLEALPDGSAPMATVVLAAGGTVAAGATAAEVAGRGVRWSIGAAGVVLFLALVVMMRAVEATGAEGAALPLVAAISIGFTGLLAGGAWLRRRRALLPLRR